MERTRWHEVEEVFHRALERPVEMRAVFVDNACGQDAELRQEVESLLEHDRLAEGFLESYPRTTTATLPEGTLIGAYQILSLLGAGGMGEVYRARDMKLGRDVALKTLPKEFALNQERLARFQHEARTLASLNHPNIAAIYGIEESGGTTCLVLELVEGETLRGPLPIERALEVARQVAEALEDAHAKGIIHRDLKPANLKTTRDGRIKMLDFGLAKAVWDAEPETNEPQVEGTVGLETVAGMIMGTPGYMSPEQASGSGVDQRTDIWAFGCLLYELLTGKPAFPAETLEDRIAAVRKSEPDWDALPAKTPAKIRELLRRCLRKDPTQRLSSVADARRIIEQILQPRSHYWVLAGVAIFVIVAGAVGDLLAPRQPSLSDPSKWVQLTNFPDSVTQPSLSPDGRMLTFVRGSSTFAAPGEIYVKILPSGQPVQLTNDNLAKMSPVFSPDGSRIAYTALSGFSWDTWVVPILAGQPERWLTNASGLVWAGPDHVMFSEIKSGEHMAIVSATESRGETRDIYVPSHQRGMAHRSYLSPDGLWVAIAEMDKGEWLPCRVVPFRGGIAGYSVGPPDAPCTAAAWSADGRWIYLSLHGKDNFHIWRQRFPDGPVEQITSAATEEEGLALSPDGRYLITSVGLRQRTVFLHIATADRPISLEGYAYEPSLSPDGKRLYYRVLKGGTSPALGASELWMADLGSGRNESLLPGVAITGYELSQDGKRIVFSANGSTGANQLWIASADRTDAPRRIPNAEGDMPHFLGPHEIVFHAIENGSTFAFRIREDGTGMQKLNANEINEIKGASPDEKFVVAWSQGATKAFPSSGGDSVTIMDGICSLRWQPSRKFLYLSVITGMQSAGAFGRTYVIPLDPGRLFPVIPPAGFHSGAEIARLPGVRVIEAADVFPGSTPGTYAYSRQTVQRNLYRIPLPQTAPSSQAFAATTTPQGSDFVASICRLVLESIGPAVRRWFRHW